MKTQDRAIIAICVISSLAILAFTIFLLIDGIGP